MEWISLDNRRTIVLPGDKEQTIKFSVDHFIQTAQESIDQRGHFYVALSGGSTPKTIYETLALPSNTAAVDWTKVSLFWSDERCVPPTDNESNYKMAMDSGFSKLPVPKSQIFRMHGELNPSDAGKMYEDCIRKHVPDCTFDLVMLGMGDDGHTASLFPYTAGLHISDHEAIANFLPQKNVWRLTLTYECINRSRHTAIYVLGTSKALKVRQALLGPELPDELPIQRIGIPGHKTLWILDNEASKELSTQ